MGYNSVYVKHRAPPPAFIFLQNIIHATQIRPISHDRQVLESNGWVQPTMTIEILQVFSLAITEFYRDSVHTVNEHAVSEQLYIYSLKAIDFHNNEKKNAPRHGESKSKYLFLPNSSNVHPTIVPI